MADESSVEVVDGEVVDEPSVALAILPTGEALMQDLDDVGLARGLARVGELEEELKKAAKAVGDEVIARMDRRARWGGKDWCLDDDTFVFELESQSPDAGAVAYNPDVLKGELAPLVEAGVIDQEAVDAALVRTVTASVVGEHCDRFKAAVVRYGADVEDRTKSVQRGINALGKHSDERVKAAIEKAKTVTPPASRKVKLKVKRKAGP